ENRVHHHRAAVSLQLEDVVASIGMRRSEIQCDPLIDAPAPSVKKETMCSLPGFRQPPDNGPRDRRHIWAAHADDPDATATGRSGDGGDGIRDDRVYPDRTISDFTAWHGQVCRDQTCAGSAIAEGWKGCY